MTEIEIIELAKAVGVSYEVAYKYEKQLLDFATEIRNRTLDEAAVSMKPMLRDMISRGEARREILALKGDEK